MHSQQKKYCLGRYFIDGELKEGDNIVMDRSGYHLFTEESGVTGGIDAVSTGFVNFMKPGREYLVFIKEKVESELYDYDVYTIEDRKSVV